jgi:O-antigen ligase
MRATSVIAALSAGLVFGWGLHAEGWAPAGDAAVAIGIALLAVVRGLAGPIRLDRVDGALIAMLGWAAVSAVVSSGGYLTSKTTLGWWSAAVCILCMLRPSRDSGSPVVDVIGSGVGVIGGLMLILEAVGFGAPRATGFIVNGNLSAAVLMAMALLVLSGESLPRHRLVIAGFLIIGVAATGSRAALIGLLAAIVPVVWRWPALRRPMLVAAGVLAAALVWRLLAVSDSLAWYRWTIWRAVLDLIAEQPLFGIGIANLADATGGIRLPSTNTVAQYGRIIGSAESTYLGLVVRAGLPILIPVAVAVSSAMGVVGRRATHRWPLVVGLGVFLVFHDLLSEPAVLLVFAAVLGSALPRVSFSDPGVDGFVRRAVAALACGWFLAWTVGQPALVRARWFTAPNDARTVVRITRAEPWMLEHLEFRLDFLLAQADPWTWDTAAEALALSDRGVVVAPGRARAWSLRAGAAVRTSQDLGLLPDLNDRIRTSFRRTVDLEPFLPWDRLAWAVHERSLGNRSRARELVDEALAAEPNLVSGWALRAQLALDEGDAVAARRAAQKVQPILDAHRWELLRPYERKLLEQSAAARVAVDEALQR